MRLLLISSSTPYLLYCFLSFITSFKPFYNRCKFEKTQDWRPYHHDSCLWSARIPKDVSLDIGGLEIVRVLGRIDISVDSSQQESQKSLAGGASDDFQFNQENNGKLTSVRIYDGTIDGKRCFLKEFLPVGLPFGKNELMIIRKLTAKWNRIIDDPELKSKKRSSVYYDVFPPFPRLVGHMTSDERIESLEFRQKWRRRFPSVRPPDADNLWLAYEWDNATFRTMRSFPPLPQVIEGLDYFRKDQRMQKRWLFVRKALRKALEALDFLHSCGYSHNAVNIQSLWMSTVIQQKIANLTIQLTDVGAARKLIVDDVAASRYDIIEDYYQLGFVFLEFIISCFNDDNIGSRQVRDVLEQNSQPLVPFFPRAEDVDQSQLTQREYQQVFEKLCSSDYTKLRMFVRSISKWRDASEILEQDSGAGWKLIFKMLARGSLYEEDRVTPMRITGRRLIRDSLDLFEDTLRL